MRLCIYEKNYVLHAVKNVGKQMFYIVERAHKKKRKRGEKNIAKCAHKAEREAQAKARASVSSKAKAKSCWCYPPSSWPLSMPFGLQRH